MSMGNRQIWMAAFAAAALTGGVARGEKAAPSTIQTPPPSPVRRAPVAPPLSAPPSAPMRSTAPSPPLGAERIRLETSLTEQRHGRAGEPVRYKEKRQGIGTRQDEVREERLPLRDMVSEPWLSPAGERLVAVVDDRMMTKAELDSRVALMLGDSPLLVKHDADSRQELDDARYELAQTILDQWVRTVTLAREAQVSGFVVTEKEVDEGLTKLAAGSDAAASKVDQRVKLIGVPQERLREEVRDGLLVEKMITKGVRDLDPSVYKDLFEKNPSKFLLPAQARVFHVFRAIDPKAAAKEQKKARADLDRLRKALLKAQSPADYEAIAKQSDPDAMLAAGDLGWVASDGTLPDAIADRIFRLTPGPNGTSDVFSAGAGLHIVKVLEREKGSPPTVEGARPQIENFLFERTKETVYDLVLRKHKVFINSGGLNKWREATPEEKTKQRLQAQSGGATRGPGAAPPPPNPNPIATPAAMKAAAKQPEGLTPAPATPEIDLDALSDLEAPRKSAKPTPKPPAKPAAKPRFE